MTEIGAITDLSLDIKESYHSFDSLKINGKIDILSVIKWKEWFTDLHEECKSYVSVYDICFSPVELLCDCEDCTFRDAKHLIYFYVSFEEFEKPYLLKDTCISALSKYNTLSSDDEKFDWIMELYDLVTEDLIDFYFYHVQRYEEAGANYDEIRLFAMVDKVEISIEGFEEVIDFLYRFWGEYVRLGLSQNITN